MGVVLAAVRCRVHCSGSEGSFCRGRGGQSRSANASALEEGEEWGRDQKESAFKETRNEMGKEDTLMILGEIRLRHEVASSRDRETREEREGERV